MVKAPPKSRGSKKLFLVILGAVAAAGGALIAIQARGAGPAPRIVAELPPGDAGKAQPYVYGSLNNIIFTGIWIGLILLTYNLISRMRRKFRETELS